MKVCALIEPPQVRNNRWIYFPWHFYLVTVHFSGSGKPRKMWCQAMSVVTLTNLNIPLSVMFTVVSITVVSGLGTEHITQCHVYSGLNHSGQWSWNIVILPCSYDKHKSFGHMLIYWNLQFWESPLILTKKTSGPYPSVLSSNQGGLLWKPLFWTHCAVYTHWTGLRI